VHCTGPSRATAGLGKPLWRGPITTSFRMRPDRAVQREETCVGLSPHHLTRGLRERRKLPQRGSGGAPAENGFYAYLSILRSEKKPPGTLFSIFEWWRGPPNVAGPGKTPPLDGPVGVLLVSLIFENQYFTATNFGCGGIFNEHFTEYSSETFWESVLVRWQRPVFWPNLAMSGNNRFSAFFSSLYHVVKESVGCTDYPLLAFSKFKMASNTL